MLMGIFWSGFGPFSPGPGGERVEGQGQQAAHDDASTRTYSRPGHAAPVAQSHQEGQKGQGKRTLRMYRN